MIFFTKLTKRKKSSNFSSAFTLVELVIVIIIIGIIVSSFSFNFAPDKLKLAADRLSRDIRYTQSLALKDDKYQPFPNANTVSETNRSKYWFKQWWQLRIGKTSNGDYFYEIFSDSPYTTSSSTSSMFNRVGYPFYEFAKDPINKKYLAGNEGNEELNLSKYGIVKILFNGSSINTTNSSKLLFDNYGNVYLNEGLQGDGNDTNPLDLRRELLTEKVKIQLCTNSVCDIQHCKQINVTPTGFVYQSECN